MSRAFAAAALVAGAGLAWWEGGLSRDQASAHYSVLAVIGLGFLTMALGGRGRQAMPSSQWARSPLSLHRHLATDRAGTLAAVTWTVLVLAAIGWDLNSFVHQRHDLPTLSSIIGHLTSSHAGRAVVFFGWLVLGGALALGWRRRR
jgi:hypothetical protein